jgi:hypothetical protein
MLLLGDDRQTLVDFQGAQWLAKNMLMQILFLFCHLSASILFWFAIVSMFASEKLDYFKMLFGSHNCIYIIIGGDQRTLKLGENIATNDGRKKRPDAKKLVVFLLECDANFKMIYREALRFNAIVRVMNNKYNLLYWLKTAGLGKRSKSRANFHIIFMPDTTAMSDKVLLTLDYAKLKNINQNNLDIHAIPRSEWERKKIESITQTLSNGHRKYLYVIHIFDETNVLLRKMLEKHPPYECKNLRFNEYGVAGNNFTVMILGFGNIGQHALLRLIMNGQFVGSRMKVAIIDKNIDCLRADFLHRYPSLNLCCEAEFLGFDVRSEEFFNLLNKINQHLDYVVVSLNDDEISKQTAVNIRLHYECRNIADLPFIAVFNMYDGSVDTNKEDKMFVFGCRDEIYKESVIIRERSDRLARAVHSVYTENYGGKQWHELDWFFQESNRASADHIPTMLKLAKLNENDARNLDSLTDNASLEEILAQTEHLRWNAFHVAMGYRPMSIKEMQSRLETFDGNRNSTEQITYSRQDPKARLHVCLANWNELNKVSEAYRELELLIGQEPKRDFKDDDRNIIRMIPKFLTVANYYGTENVI